MGAPPDQSIGVHPTFELHRPNPSASVGPSQQFEQQSAERRHFLIIDMGKPHV